MAPVDLPYLNTYRVRGRLFAYYRRNALRVRLRGEPGSPEFLAAYAAAHARAEAAIAGVRVPGLKPPAPGSFGALVALYRSAPEYRKLADGSRAGYDRILKPLLDRFGDLPVASIPRAWVLAMRDELQDTPRAANYRVAVISRLLNFAIDRGLRTDNPAARVQSLACGPGHRRWTNAEVAAMTGAEAGDVALPVMIALHTAQRLGDVLRLLWSAYDGERIRLRQSKTGADLVIPVSEDLKAVLDATRRQAAVICTTEAGRAWKPDWFKHRFAQVRAKLGLPDDMHFHGLRHSRASELAEAGASDAEIQAVTGHKTRAMVARYTRGARQEHLARAAIARLPRTRQERPSD